MVHWELFEHTADLGLRIEAPDLASLLAQAAAALFSVIVDNLEDVRADTPVEVCVHGADPDYLLLDWLGELLAIFDTRHMLLCRFEVRVDQAGLKAMAWGEPIDLARHRLAHEVKAITYHGLIAQRDAAGWRAEVIVDI